MASKALDDLIPFLLISQTSVPNSGHSHFVPAHRPCCLALKCKCSGLRASLPAASWKAVPAIHRLAPSHPLGLCCKVALSVTLPSPFDLKWQTTRRESLYPSFSLTALKPPDTLLFTCSSCLLFVFPSSTRM